MASLVCTENAKIYQRYLLSAFEKRPGVRLGWDALGRATALPALGAHRATRVRRRPMSPPSGLAGWVRAQAQLRAESDVLSSRPRGVAF